MNSIFEYLDYRVFLKDFYETRKQENPYFSYRVMGRKVDMDASHLVKVLQGKRHISHTCVDRFTSLCSFNEREADFFTALVRFNKATAYKEIKFAYEQLLALKDVTQFTLQKSQYEYYQKWYYTAIFVLLNYYSFNGDYEALGRRLSPAISADEARAAVDLLIKLGLVKESEKGIFEITNADITCGNQPKSLLVRSFQEETIRMAAESLNRHHPDRRDVSTVTVTIREEDLPALRDMIAEFRAAIIKYAQRTAVPDSVYQFNIQLFPLTAQEKRRAKESSQ